MTLILIYMSKLSNKVYFNLSHGINAITIKGVYEAEKKNEIQ